MSAPKQEFEFESATKFAPEPQAPAPPSRPTPLFDAARFEGLGRMAALAAIVALPAAVAIAVQLHVGSALHVHDDVLNGATGANDTVTAMEWSPEAAGVLFVGTQAGRLLRVARDGTVAEAEPDPGSRPVVAIAANTASGRGATGFLPALWRLAGWSGAETLEPAAIPLSMLRDVADAGEGSPFDIVGVGSEAGLFAAVSDLRTSFVSGIGLSGQPDVAQMPTAPATTLGLSLHMLERDRRAVEIGRVFGIEDVRTVAHLPGTRFVVAGDGAGGVFLIDAAEQISGVSPDQYVFRIGGHEAAITHVAAASSVTEGAAFATAAADGGIRVWYPSRVSGLNLFLSPDFDPSLCCQPFEVLHAGEGWREVETLEGFDRLLAMSDDGRHLAMLDEEGRLAVLARDRTGQGRIRTMTSVRAAETGAAFRPGHDQLATTTFLTEFERFALHSLDDPDTATMLLDFMPQAIAFDRSGRFLAVAHDQVGQMDLERGEAGRQWSIEITGRTTTLAYSPDGALVSVGFADGRIALIDAVRGELLATATGEIEDPPSIVNLAFSADGKRLMVVDEAGAARAHSLRSLRRMETPSASAATGVNPREADGPQLFPFLSGDGSRIFVAGGTVRAHDWPDLREGLTLFPTGLGEDGFLGGALTDGTGSTIALVSGGTVSIWERGGATEPWRALDARPPMPRPAPGGLVLSADGTTLLVRGTSGTLHAARLGRPGEGSGPAGYLRPLAPDLRAVGIAVDVDGSRAFAARTDGAVEMLVPDWDRAGYAVQTRERRVLAGHAGVGRLAISPDGGHLATASVDGRLRIVALDRAVALGDLPLADLPAGPAIPALEAMALFDEPDAFLDETLTLKIQRGLNAAGAGLVPDGILGAVTRAEILEYQRGNELPQTGVPDRALYRHLKQEGFIDGRGSAPAQAASASPGPGREATRLAGTAP